MNKQRKKSLKSGLCYNLKQQFANLNLITRQESQVTRKHQNDLLNPHFMIHCNKIRTKKKYSKNSFQVN